MANCFNELIGIRGTCDEGTHSLYINDLPYVGLDIANALLGAEDADGEAYITGRLNYTYNLVKSEIHSLLAPMMKSRTVIENNTLGYYKHEMTALPASAKYRGVRIKLEDFPFLAFKINGVAMFSSNFTGNLPIKVFDMVTGGEIDTFSIAVVAGEISYIPINKEYLTQRQLFDVFFAYNATNIDTYRTSIYAPNSGCYDCNKRSDGYRGKYLTFDGAEANLGSTVSSTVSQGNSSGLSLKYTIECSMDGWLCSMKDRFAFSMLQRFGVVMMEEILAGSKRMNSVTTIDNDKAQYLHGVFMSNYDKAMTGAIKGIIPPSDVCFHCNSGIRTNVRIP